VLPLPVIRRPAATVTVLPEPAQQRIVEHAARRAAGRERIVLRDGSAVLIRPVQAADAPLLRDGFARLSPQSRQLRFLSPKQELSTAELRYFADVDHHDHEALGALSTIDGRGVGVARFIRSAHDHEAAEIAVTVVDTWQGRGLGSALLAKLSDRAQQEGISRLTATVAVDNIPMIGLLHTMCAQVDGVRREGETWEYSLTLGSDDEMCA
jgi:RimJ/RimL family protein N-acetyltransferase